MIIRRAAEMRSERNMMQAAAARTTRARLLVVYRQERHSGRRNGEDECKWKGKSLLHRCRQLCPMGLKRIDSSRAVAPLGGNGEGKEGGTVHKKALEEEKEEKEE